MPNQRQDLITKHYAGLFNGMSQQAPSLRLDTQADNQVNGWSSLVYGLINRPPTKRIKTLDIPQNAKYHSIFRDDEEQYILAVDGTGGLSAWNVLNGYKLPVVITNGYARYLYSSNPKKDFELVSISDYTFLINKTVAVGRVESNGYTEMLFPATAYVTVRQKYPFNNSYQGATTSAGSVLYNILIDDATVATYSLEIRRYTTTNSDGTEIEHLIHQTPIQVVAQALASELQGRGYKVSFDGSSGFFSFSKVGGGNFKITTNDPAIFSVSYTSGSQGNVRYSNLGYVYVSRGVAEQDYKVFINDRQVAKYTSGNTNEAATYKTDLIANKLSEQISKAGYLTKLNGSVIQVAKRDYSDFTIEVTDSWGNAALKCFKGTAQSFQELPPKCFHGAILQIAGKKDSADGSFWVRYTEELTVGGVLVKSTGVWKEYREPGIPHEFNKTTMPLVVIRKQDINKYADANNPYGIYFSVEPSNFNERKVGDENSNPFPSFVGSTINGIFTYADRLGIISGNSISLTASGSYFDFFHSTVTDVLDDAPIDLTAPSSEASELLYTVPTKGALLIFSEHRQFFLDSGGEPLTPTTANIQALLKYPCQKNVKPINIGQMAYFASPNGDYTMIREYDVQAGGVVGEAPINNEQAPRLITRKYSNDMWLLGLTNDDILIVSNGSTKAFVYKYSWNGDQKTQSSWSIWEFSRDIVFMFESAGVPYILFKDGSLETIKMEINKDEKMIDSQRVIAKNTEITGQDGLCVYDKSYNLLRKLNSGESATYTQDVIVGFPFEFIYDFSPIFLKSSQNTPAGEIEGASLLRRLLLYLDRHTEIDVAVVNKQNGKDRIKYHFKSPTTSPQEHYKHFLLRGESKESIVRIKSSGVTPVGLHSASFDILMSFIGEPQ